MIRTLFAAATLAIVTLGVAVGIVSQEKTAQASTFYVGSSGACPGTNHWDSSYIYEYSSQYIGSNDYVSGKSLFGYNDGLCQVAVGYSQATNWGYASIRTYLQLSDTCDGYNWSTFLSFSDIQYNTDSGNTGVGHGDYLDCLENQFHTKEVQNWGDYHDWFGNDWWGYGYVVL